MAFNTYTWNATQPSPSQLISDGQATILNNFSFLNYAGGSAFPGYVMLPNGLIFQWGNTGALTAEFANTILFTNVGLQAFPNNLLLVLPVIRSSTIEPTTIRTIQVSTNNFTKTQFVLISIDTLNSGCDFLAIGN